MEIVIEMTVTEPLIIPSKNKKFSCYQYWM